MIELFRKLKELFAPIGPEEESLKAPPAPRPRQEQPPAPVEGAVGGDIVAVIALALERLEAERRLQSVSATAPTADSAAADGWVLSGRIEQVNRGPRFDG